MSDYIGVDTGGNTMYWGGHMRCLITLVWTQGVCVHRVDYIGVDTGGVCIGLLALCGRRGICIGLLALL